MTPRAVRKAERLVHLSWGLLIALYVYDVLPAWGEPVVTWIAVPGIIGSGFAMWFAAPIRRLVTRSLAPSGRATAARRTVPSTHLTSAAPRSGRPDGGRTRR